MKEHSDSAPAVVVDDVVKTFRMPHERVHTLKERVLHPLRSSRADTFTALDNVSFQVERGEFFGIVGRNGSGKSTLLKCMAGIYPVDQGAIRIDGRLSTFIELGVGFNPDLAARDNALINAIMLGLSPREANERFDDILRFAELEEFVDLKLKNYSSGMHVRLAFSVMIQVDADVLLVDEVLAVGDAAFQQKCFDVFNRLRDEGKTILFVTHDMGSVKRFCHRALLIERGKVRIVGDPARVGQHYLEMNFGRDHTADGDHDPEGDRFGDQKAEIAEAWFEAADGDRSDVVPQKDAVVFKMRVVFHAPIDDPVCSVLIENEQHVPVFASSTQWLESRGARYEAGEEALFTVRVENLFQPGRFFATPWVSRGESQNDLLDRRERMASFLNAGVSDSGALMQAPHDVSMERLAAPSQTAAR